MKAIKNFFEKRRLLKEINSTFTVLIPKVPNAATQDQFRPISLCNFLYKVITKILANRLKQVIPSLVRPTQTTFIKNGSIGENKRC